MNREQWQQKRRQAGIASASLEDVAGAEVVRSAAAMASTGTVATRSTVAHGQLATSMAKPGQKAHVGD